MSPFCPLSSLDKLRNRIHARAVWYERNAAETIGTADTRESNLRRAKRLRARLASLKTA